MAPLVKSHGTVLATLTDDFDVAPQLRMNNNARVMTDPTFQLDPKLAPVVAAYAQDAVDIAEQSFGIALDGSAASLEFVEQVLRGLHDEMENAAPSEQMVWTVATAFGSYLGEVLRRYHSAEWGLINMNGQDFPGMRQPDGGLVWPWIKAHKRLTLGAEHDVWHYYQVLAGVREATPSEG